MRTLVLFDVGQLELCEVLPHVFLSLSIRINHEKAHLLSGSLHPRAERTF